VEIQARSSQNVSMNVQATNMTEGDNKAFIQVRGRASAPGNPNLLDALIREVKVVSPGVPQVI
jgi:hypothetical protein